MSFIFKAFQSEKQSILDLIGESGVSSSLASNNGILLYKDIETEDTQILDGIIKTLSSGKDMVLVQVSKILMSLKPTRHVRILGLHNMLGNLLSNIIIE